MPPFRRHRTLGPGVVVNTGKFGVAHVCAQCAFSPVFNIARSWAVLARLTAPKPG
jgi:hypothetical protein